MAKTYIELMAEIEQLQSQAAKLKDREKSEVVARIKQAIAVYGFTAKDLGLDKPGRAASKKTATRKAKGAKGAGRKPRAATAPKFRDDAGNVWSGRGPRPIWLRNALASGASLESFAVQGA